MSSLAENDMGLAIGLMSGREAFCRVCKNRVDSSRCAWRTCSPWDETFICRRCKEDEEEARIKAGEICHCGRYSKPNVKTGFCNKCFNEQDLHVIKDASDARYDGSLIKSDETFKKLTTYRTKNLRMEFVYDKPGVSFRYVEREGQTMWSRDHEG